jgi:hypothetical protein
LRGRSRRIKNSRLVWAKLLRPYLEKQNANKRSGDMTQWRTCLSIIVVLGYIQYHKKKKKRKEGREGGGRGEGDGMKEDT